MSSFFDSKYHEVSKSSLFLFDLSSPSFSFFFSFSSFFFFFFHSEKIFVFIGKAPSRCPVCRSVFAPPATSTTHAASLPINHFASSVLSPAADEKKKQQVNPNEIKCEICEDNEEDATSYCVQCSQYLCAGCEKGHKRLKGTAFHELVSVEKALKGKMKASVVQCEKHSHLEINYYCHTDKQAICSECAVELHKGHEVEKLTDVVQGFKKEISKLINEVSFFFSFFFYIDFPLTKVLLCVNKIKQHDSELCEVIKVIAATMSAVCEQAKATEEVIHSTIEKLISLLRDREAALLSDVDHQTPEREGTAATEG